MEINKKTLRNVFLVAVSCIVLYWCLHETERARSVISWFSGIVAPFVLGAGLAFIINVPMRSIEGMLRGVKNENLRRILALVLTLLAVVLVLTLVFQLLIPQVAETAEAVAAKVPGFIVKTQTVITDFLNDNPELMQWVMENTDFASLDIAGIAQKVLDVVGSSVSAVVSGAFVAITDIAGAIFNAVIGVVFAIYCLFRKEILARQGRRLLYAFVPEKVSDKVVEILRLTNSTFSNFLSGQCLEVLILGCMFAVSMAIFGMPYIPLVSVLVAVTAFIPLVGAFVGCALGALFILVNDPMQAVWFVIMFLVLQQIENNLIYPRVVGTSIGLPGMWVLVAVAFGGELMGVAGMFLMIPLTSVVYTLLRELTNYLLSGKNIAPEKLMDHPPELKSGFKENRERNKKVRHLRRLSRKQKNAPQQNNPQ